MKILIYSDNHYSTYSSIIKSRQNKYSTRITNQIETLNWIQNLAEERNCDKIICLGDFFDKPDLTSEEISALNEIKWSKSIPQVFLVGNHEIGSKNLEFNSTNALSKIGSVIHIPETEIINETQIVYLPYMFEDSRKPLNDIINEFDKNNCKKRIILSHNDIAGIEYGHWRSNIGFTIEEIEENCDLFINGHLHNQNQITKKILNIGNVTGQNFSEDSFKYSHCVGVLDTDTLEIELIVNDNAFNFYKIFVDDIEEFKQVCAKLKKVNNPIATITCSSDLLEEVRSIAQDVFKEMRIIIAHIKKKTEIKRQFEHKDHIEQFKQYIIKELGTAKILLEELNLLK